MRVVKYMLVLKMHKFLLRMFMGRLAKHCELDIHVVFIQQVAFLRNLGMEVIFKERKFVQLCDEDTIRETGNSKRRLQNFLARNC
jgi:hypothetical protein